MYHYHTFAEYNNSLSNPLVLWGIMFYSFIAMAIFLAVFFIVLAIGRRKKNLNTNKLQNKNTVQARTVISNYLIGLIIDGAIVVVFWGIIAALGLFNNRTYGIWDNDSMHRFVFALPASLFLLRLITRWFMKKTLGEKLIKTPPYSSMTKFIVFDGIVILLSYATIIHVFTSP